MKTVFASHVMIADFIRADAGVQEAVFESRLSALYTAYYHVLKSGNKTQWNIVDAAVRQFADIKACKEALQVTTSNNAVKRMHAVYLAYGAALAHVGVPTVMKGADHDAIDGAAATMATEFATMVQVALTPEAKAVPTEADKEAKKAAKAKAESEAKAATEAAIRTEAEKLANANVVTLADMVRIVANALQSGMLDDDAVAVLADASEAYNDTVQAAELRALLAVPADTHA